jgi:hypothetical protein
MPTHQVKPAPKAKPRQQLSPNGLMALRYAAVIGPVVPDFEILPSGQCACYGIRREGFKLTLSGRSPIEYADVPRDIPNQVKHFYRDAVVADQSGQTLAGIFLLRTLIEQWARSKVPSDQLLADAVLDAYMSALPENFKRQFKSFRELYRDLSVDIHAARGDPALFNEARDKIVEHFEARRLFRL